MVPRPRRYAQHHMHGIDRARWTVFDGPVFADAVTVSAFRHGCCSRWRESRDQCQTRCSAETMHGGYPVSRTCLRATDCVGARVTIQLWPGSWTRSVWWVEPHSRAISRRRAAAATCGVAVSAAIALHPPQLARVQRRTAIALASTSGLIWRCNCVSKRADLRTLKLRGAFMVCGCLLWLSVLRQCGTQIDDSSI